MSTARITGAPSRDRPCRRAAGVRAFPDGSDVAGKAAAENLQPPGSVGERPWAAGRICESAAPLDLQLPAGRIRYPAEPSMRLLARPLLPRVSYRAGVLQGLLTGR